MAPHLESTTTLRWQTAPGGADTGTLAAAFALRAQATPRAPAVVCRDRIWSYGDVARRAARLAARLAAAGASPARPVAVAMERGWEQVPAVLGVLGSGAAYLPIDPAWPEPLRSRILREEGVDLVVTQEALVASLRRGDARALVTVGAEAPADGCELPFAPRARPDDVACVFYRGAADRRRPSRAAVDHRTALRHVERLNARLHVDAEDGLFAVAPLTSPSSLYDLLGPLTAGATVIVPADDEVASPRHWLELLEDYEGTVWSSRPELLRLLVDEALHSPASSMASLRIVLLHGDELSFEVAHVLRALAPRATTVRVRGAVTEEIDTGWPALPSHQWPSSRPSTDGFAIAGSA
jgi:non-ribosomal peptide synthetase component F